MPAPTFGEYGLLMQDSRRQSPDGAIIHKRFTQLVDDADSRETRTETVVDGVHITTVSGPMVPQPGVARIPTDAALATQLRCTDHQLTGIRTARYAIGMRLAMRIVQWLARPASAFIDAAEW